MDRVSAADFHRLTGGATGYTILKNQQNRYSNWRVSDKKILIFAFPMLWKKLPMTICAPTSGNMATAMRTPLEAISINSSSLVKMADMAWKYGFIDRRGNEVIAPIYDGAADFSEVLAAVGQMGKYYVRWGFVDAAGSYWIQVVVFVG